MKRVKRDLYKILAISNDIKAVRKGRVGHRMWNRFIMRMMRKLMR